MKYFTAVAAIFGGLSLVSANAIADAPTATSDVEARWVDSASAPIITVTVGANKQLLFDPPTINGVGQGQRIHFDFRALNHTFTESSFANPCTKNPYAQFDTDFNNANPNDIPNFKPFDITLDSGRPRFFYCRQANKTPKSHCAAGMVFAVNIDQYTFTQFLANAKVDGLPKIKGRSPMVLEA